MQTKVLLVVLGLLVLLPLLVVVIVQLQTSQLALEQSRQALKTAEGVFRKYLDIREDNLVTGYRNMVTEPRFRAIVTQTQRDVATMNDFLKGLLGRRGEEGEALLFFTTEKAELLGSARRDASVAVDALERAVRPLLRGALEGEVVVDSIRLNERAYTVIAHPVSPGQGGAVVGILVAAIRIGEPTLRDLRDLTGTEVVLVANGGIIASSQMAATASDTWLREVAPARRGQTHEGSPVIVNHEHFLALNLTTDLGAATPALGYVLLYSYEKSVQALAETRQTILGVSAAGIGLSALLVSWFVRRVTRPLRDLRDSAEAVGRGDFSRRIERFSNDEVGDLAQEFNRMTTNLQTSRAELERAMQTVKATQAQLIQSEKLSAVGQFVAGVAHELNNPLTAVVGFSELLQTMPSEGKNHAYLDRIAKSAMRCHKIVQSLLSFARQQTPERKLVQLHGVIEDVLEIMAYDLRTSGITVVKEFAPALPVITADPHQLQQVFVNILSNARQAIEPSQREGKMTIRTHVRDSMISVEFEDNGPGIRPENLARIFDPFFTTKPVGKGTGLGLSLCYGIIQEHGGNIRVRSEPGSGATFIIDLPVARELTGDVIRRGGTNVPFSDAEAVVGRSILVIDDEPWILDLAVELLRGDGHRVQTVLGGQQALELLERDKFDVIVSDWKMPGLNGVRLYEHLLASDPAAAKRVLFMTGDVVSDTFQDFLKLHSLICLSKPFAVGEFRAAVARISKET